MKGSKLKHVDNLGILMLTDEDNAIYADTPKNNKWFIEVVKLDDPDDTEIVDARHVFSHYFAESSGQGYYLHSELVFNNKNRKRQSICASIVQSRLKRGLYLITQ